MHMLKRAAVHLRLAITLIGFALSAVPAFADARITVLVDVLKLAEAAQILHDEGLDHAADLNAEMLDGKGGAGWQMQSAAIYDAGRMLETVRTALAAELQGPDNADTLEAIIAFFASDLGTKIVSLENAARAAIQDNDVEAAARARYAALRGSDDARFGMITALVESGDMINRNVTAAMNSNYQFLRGLSEGGAAEMTEDEMLQSVTADVDAITEDTIAWLHGYLLLAYHPLSDDELQTYLTFSQSDAGQTLNRGLFDGFGKAYEDISYALGRAVALNMTAKEL